MPWLLGVNHNIFKKLIQFISTLVMMSMKVQSK